MSSNTPKPDTAEEIQQRERKDGLYIAIFGAICVIFLIVTFNVLTIPAIIIGVCFVRYITSGETLRYWG